MIKRILLLFFLFSCPSFADTTEAEKFEDNFLILRVYSEDLVLSDAMMAYLINDELYLPISQLSETLYFPIEVFYEEQKAEGWFNSPENTFSLNLQENKLILRGEEVNLPIDYIKDIDDDLFIPASLLNQWFSLTFDLNTSKLLLEINSDEPLAFKERIKRAKNWEKVNNKKYAKEQYTRYKNPYNLATFPSTVMSLQYTYSDNEGDNFNYYMSGNGDLLNMSSFFYFYGNDEEMLQGAQFKLYRYDIDGNLLWGNATKFAIGDISTPIVPIIGGGGLERGVYVSNESIGSVSSPDNFIITGNALPNWDVEVYRNNEFVGYQTVGSNGRYEFTDISLYSGLNLFRIVKYGPYGKKEEEYQRYYLGSGLLKEGKLQYRASISQPEESVISTDGYDFGKRPNAFAGVEYGISDNLSVGVSGYSGEIDQENDEGVVLSVRGSTKGVYLTGDYLYTKSGGYATNLSARTNIEKTDLSLSFEKNNGFENEDTDYKLTGSVGRTFEFNNIPDIFFRLNAYDEKFQSGNNKLRVSQKLSTNILGQTLSNDITWEQETDQDALVYGDFYARKRYGTSVVRLAFDYNVQPETEIKSLDVRFERPIDENKRLSVNYVQPISNEGNPSVSADITWDTNYFYSGIGATYEDSGAASITFHTRFSLYKPPSSKMPTLQKLDNSYKGTVMAHAYLDNNNNDEFDEGDENITEARFTSHEDDKTDENGKVELGGLTSYTQFDAILQTSSLSDIFYMPKEKGYTLVPRDGIITELEYPLIIAGEVDGYLETKDGEPIGKEEVLLKRTSGEVMEASITDKFGYYIFQKLPVGKYVVESMGMMRTVEITAEEPLAIDQGFVINTVSE